jgi:hypothetical protein
MEAWQEGSRAGARLEAECQDKELRLAAANLLREIPGLAVEAYFVDFEGVWAVALAKPS